MSTGKRERCRQDDFFTAGFHAHVNAANLERRDVHRTREQAAQAPLDPQLLQLDAKAALCEGRALGHEAARQGTRQSMELQAPAQRGLDAAGGPAERFRTACEPEHATRACARHEQQHEERQQQVSCAPRHQNLTPSEK